MSPIARWQIGSSRLKYRAAGVDVQRQHGLSLVTIVQVATQ